MSGKSGGVRSRKISGRKRCLQLPQQSSNQEMLRGLSTTNHIACSRQRRDQRPAGTQSDLLLSPY